MKKTVSLLLAATTLLAACNKQEQMPLPEPQTYGTIQLSIDADSGLQTKAVEAYTTAQT